MPTIRLCVVFNSPLPKDDLSLSLSHQQHMIVTHTKSIDREGCHQSTYPHTISFKNFEVCGYMNIIVI